jgi:hypothetical protein
MKFPEAVRDGVGTALSVAQFGGKHPAAKPWTGEGPGVLDVVEDRIAPCALSGSLVQSMFCIVSKRSRTTVSEHPSLMSNWSHGD